jgi:hypothetical protein
MINKDSTFGQIKTNAKPDFVREHGNVARPKYSNNQLDQMTIKCTNRRGPTL